MKKICFLILLVGAITNINAQNIVQITQNSGGNNTTKSHENCGLKINGICSCEDIGGVGLEEISRVAHDEGVFSNGTTTAYLRNYNNFTVTVLIQLAFESRTKYVEETYQVVIPSNEKKGVVLRHCNCPGCYTLQGMIVRRLRN